MIKLKIDPIRTYNRQWHQNVMNLLLGKDVCGSCLCLNEDLVQWEVDFVLQRDDINTVFSLKNIMLFTFGSSIVDIVSAVKFCQKCIDVILKAYFLLQTIHNNYKHIQSKLSEITQQMKWTEHLDETGSLKDNKNKVKPNDITKLTHFNHTDAKTQTNVGIETESNVSVEQSMIKHKIMLDNESLKTKLIQDPQMHRFLFKRETHKKPKLPAGITVRKVRKSIDMTDIAPHELLELNWADETDYDTVIPNTLLSKNKLHSNEALIMNLMEKAKSGEHYTNYKQSFNYVGTFSKAPESLNLNDSLTVKLVHGSETNANSIDNTDIVPQDLLELKWPEDQDCTSMQCMKIPVKKLNFNEALTVKFIPKHSVCTSKDSFNDIAPHELLELNWNEEPEDVGVEHTNLPETQKHKIDLTQWLQDQGMSIIKTIKSTHEKKGTPNTNAQEVCLNANETKMNPHNESKHASVVEHKILNQNDVITKPNTKNDQHLETIDHEKDNSLDCNKKVKIDAVSKPEGDNIEALRCALCNLIFNKFESYKNHYKTHSIIEPAKCYKCPSQHPVIALLIEHLFVMHSESVTYCNMCFAMLNQDKLAEHVSNHHAQNIEVIGVWKDKIDNIKDNEYCNKCKQPYKFTSHPHTCVNINSRCNECQHACIHEKYLSSYRKQLKKKKEIYKCTNCKFNYSNMNEIIKHANTVHLKHKPHRCNVCNVGFLLKTSLAKHNNLYHARCNSCGRDFESSRSMSRHKCKYNVATDVKCELCGQRFSEENYKLHKESALAATDNCVLCPQTIPVKCNMSRHMQDIHNLCLKKETGKTVYECIICERDFENDADFSQHSLVHKGVHECHVCAKRFKTKALYETHYQMHLATECVLSKSFKCSVCSEQLIDKYAWAHHMLSHKDYEKCQICSKYIKTETIDQHVESHEVLEKKFKCPHCPLICNSHNQFEVHVNRFHLQNRPYQCDICKKCFYSKHLMRQHIKLHAKLKPCGLCDKKFARKCSLDIHMRVHSAS